MSRSPWYKLAFILLLAVPQLAAFCWQFNAGFRPFLHEPGRVPLSWDMFATTALRCTVNWTPPLHVESRTLTSLRDVQLPLEWDIINDHIDDYRELATWLCQKYTEQPTEVQMRCFFPEGVKSNERFSCP